LKRRRETSFAWRGWAVGATYCLGCAQAKRASGEKGVAGATRSLREHTLAHIDRSRVVLVHQSLVSFEKEARVSSPQPNGNC